MQNSYFTDYSYNNYNNSINSVNNSINDKSNLNNMYNYMIKQDIYNSIVEYYGDVIFTKLNSKATSDGNFYGLYYCKVGCMLCIDNRYLLAIVKEEIDVPIGTHIYLSNLNWISFQSRSIDEFDTVNPYNIKIKQQGVKNNRNTITDIEMRLIDEQNDRVIYECSENYPITVDIMKKKSKEKNIYNMMDGYEKEFYTKTCSLQTLLESYQCVLTINM
jgi:hypothetical protein